jgi:hypothetical protein
MRNAILALIAVTAASVATLADTAPAAARTYPYCITGGGYGYPGDCSYSSYAQCRASASGRRVDCNLNPRVAFRQPRHRDYRTY